MLQEIAEPLFDLKLGMEQLSKNKTFKRILATLLAIGNFLNCAHVSAPSPPQWVLGAELPLKHLDLGQVLQSEACWTRD